MKLQRTLAASVACLLAGLLLPAQAALAATTPEPGVSTLINASFDKDEAATGWKRMESGANMAVITEGAHDGAHYLRVNQGTAGSGASVYQDVAVATTAGQSFTGSIWVRSDSGTGLGTLALWGMGGGSTETESTNFTATSQWQQIHVPLDTTTNHDTLRLQVYMGSNIQFALDGAQLTPQVISNASFDRDVSASSWRRMEAGSNWAVMTTGAHDGTHYLRANQGTAGSGASVYQDVALATTAGQSFTGSMWVRSDSGEGTGTLALWGMGGGGNESRETKFTATSQWQQVHVPLDTTTNHTALRLQVYMSSNIQFALDGAQLAPEAISNASFERDASASSWKRMETGSNWSVVTQNAHDGRHYLRANQGTAGSGASVYQDVAVPTLAGQSFTGSIWVRSDSGNGVGTLALWGIGGGGIEGGSTDFTATSQWQQIQVPLDTNLAHDTLRLQVYMGSNIQFALDGARLSKAPTPPPAPAPEPTPTPSQNCSAVTGPVPSSHTSVVSGIRVHTCLSTNLGSLLNDAAAAGIPLSGGGWRSYQSQVDLRIKNCGGNTPYNIYQKPANQCSPPTAIPGRSMHERGLAIDFTQGGASLTSGSSGYRWLVANAARYGLYNLPSEPWHWSTNGH